MELLKLSATKNCTVSTWQGYPVSHRPALTLGVLYHQGTAGVPADDSEAELWMARNAAHCGYSHNEFFPVEGLSKEQYQAQQQAWSQLAGRTYVPGSTPPSSQQ
jgi:TPR repeat protein